ncbi:hypothetical protein D9Q98_006983 [Chlorella vulgaris]|uniref:CID domain-containing protein n=1 Tax=Chlorella vulgaris TaxID=3077 RepID=A0A9D4TJ85_CHLVU|nr:hypothetical protein D9Q98_006983 [Chlorella vulgaris]
MALNEAIFRSKLDQLNPSQQSIEGTSAWCLFHRQDARRVAEVWEDYFSHADQAKRLAMVYLANDIVQNGRKKGKEFLEEFFRVLPRALRHLLGKGDEKTKQAVNKVIRVWDERKVFGSGGSKTFAEMVHGAEALVSPRGPASSSQPQPERQQHQAQQHQDPHQQQALPTAVPPQLASALQQAAAAAQQTSQLQAAVAAAVPLALGHAAAPDQVSAARGAAQGLGAALQHELVVRQGAAEQLRQLLSQQEGAAAQLGAHLQACSQQLSQLDGKLAQMQQQAAAPAAPAPAQQLHGGASSMDASSTAAVSSAGGAAAAGAAAAAGGAAAAGSHASEAASLAAALTQSTDSAAALLAALMEMPQDQQDGLGAELAGMLQSPAGDAGGGDDLYDPEDF